MRAVQAGLHIADDRIHPFEVRQIAGLSAASDDDLMMTICIGDSIEAGQAIGQHEGGRCKTACRPVRDGLSSEARERGQFEIFWMTLMGQGDCGNKRHFVLGAPTHFAARSFSSEIDVVDRHESLQPVALFAEDHRLHQLVLNHPRLRITDAQMPLEGQSRNPSLGQTDQINGQKPDGQWKFGVLKERHCNDRCLVIAGTTLERCAPTSLQPITQPMTTSRALESVGPAFPLKSLLTLGFIAELLMKFKKRHAFLELYGVDSHG